MTEQIEKLEHGLMICEATGTELVHIEKADAEKILVLLKEQEAVEPKKKSDGNPGRWASWWYVCGNCGEEIDWHDMYCRHCGREVKWNES